MVTIAVFELSICNNLCHNKGPFISSSRILVSIVSKKQSLHGSELMLTAYVFGARQFLTATRRGKNSLSRADNNTKVKNRIESTRGILRTYAFMRRFHDSHTKERYSISMLQNSLKQFNCSAEYDYRIVV